MAILKSQTICSEIHGPSTVFHYRIALFLSETCALFIIRETILFLNTLRISNVSKLRLAKNLFRSIVHSNHTRSEDALDDGFSDDD